MSETGRYDTREQREEAAQRIERAKRIHANARPGKRSYPTQDELERIREFERDH